MLSSDACRLGALNAFSTYDWFMEVKPHRKSSSIYTRRTNAGSSYYLWDLGSTGEEGAEALEEP